MSRRPPQSHRKLVGRDVEALNVDWFDFEFPALRNQPKHSGEPILII